MSGKLLQVPSPLVSIASTVIVKGSCNDTENLLLITPDLKNPRQFITIGFQYTYTNRISLNCGEPVNNFPEVITVAIFFIYSRILILYFNLII